MSRIFWNIVFNICSITETLHRSHGNYTASTIDRASKLVGQLGAALDAAFHQNVCATDTDDSYRQRKDYADDVKMFCAEYKQDRLFDIVLGRRHKAFAEFSRHLCVNEEAKLKSRLLKYSRKLDQCRLLNISSAAYQAMTHCRSAES